MTTKEQIADIRAAIRQFTARLAKLKSISALLLVLAISGCSSVKQIGNTAVRVQQNARIASTSLAGAVATGEVGPTALPMVETAQTAVDEIEGDAAAIVDVINSGMVVDRENPIWTWIKRFWWLLFLIACIVLSVIYAPVIRPVLLIIGAWLHIIPKPVKAQAAADATFIADPNPIGPEDLDRIRSIERSKDDPRYHKALDEELTAKGILT